MAQTVNNLSATQETQVQSPGWEDPLEMEMATHSGYLSCLENSLDRGIQWDTGQSGHKEVDVTEQLTLSLWLNSKLYMYKGSIPQEQF